MLVRIIEKNKVLLISALLLLLTLGSWSIASPILSAPDAANHIAHIWCSTSFDNDHCEKDTEELGTYRIPTSSSFCYPENTLMSAACASPATSIQTISTSNYPSLFFRVLNFFVTDRMNTSIILMRFFNSSIFVGLFFFQILLGSEKHRLAYLSANIFTITPYLLFLIPSVNPSSWAIIGVTNSAFFLISLLDGRKSSPRIRAAVCFFWFLSSVLCFARFDSTVALIVANLIVLLSLRSRKILQSFRKTAFFTSILLLAAVVLSRNFDSFLHWCIAYLRINTVPFNPLGPNFGTWLGSWLLHFWAIPIEAFGSGGLGWREIPMPQFVVLNGIGLLGAVIIFASIQMSFRQILVHIASSLFMLFNILMIANTELDLFNVTGRHIIPIFPFIVGSWVYFSRTPIQYLEIRNARFIAVLLIAASNSIALYTTIERYVMGWSGGLRIIRINGLSQWWWSDLPIGPNFVVIIGSICYLGFLSTAVALVPLKSLDSYGTVTINN
ncbi:MAG: DUF2142 domain-containing protein [Gammaproteobacteria bacterium]